MAIAQIIKHDNGDGSVTVTAVTEKGNSETRTYKDHWPSSSIDETINEAVQGALAKD